MSVTAAEVLAEATSRYGEALDAEHLGETYQSMIAMAERSAGGVFYTPEPVARAMTTFALEQAIRQDGSGDPQRILRIVACDPSCGCGVVLAAAARLLATHYAGRLFSRQPSAAQVFAVMPTVVMGWVFGLRGALTGDEARPRCRLVRDRQALWGMTDEETAALLGTTEAPWIGKATARRILLSLPGPRRPCPHESEWAGRARARDGRARGRARAAERRAS